MRDVDNGPFLDIIEREYEAFRQHHAAAQTLESPEGFAQLFREWIARVITPSALPPVKPDLDGAARLGWWVISGQAFLETLHRAHAGEDPDLVYAEQYANSDVSLIPPGGSDA